MKPIDDPKKTTVTTKKPRSKSNSLGPTFPTKSTISAGAKWPMKSEKMKDEKRSKKKSKAEVSLEKKGILMMIRGSYFKGCGARMMR